MAMRKMCLLGMVVGLVVASTSWASMTWIRGAPGSTWQDWTFDDGANPKVAEAYDNPYGAPTASITPILSPNLIPSTMLGYHSAWDGRTGVWVGDPVKVDLTIPNTPFTGGYKEVWLEVGFEGVVSANSPVLQAPGVVTEIAGSRSVQIVSGDWKKFTMGWTIVPNPQREELLLSFEGTGGFVDYVKVDTICIPEPCSLLLLAAGALGLHRMRRRSA
jgi:hypothetical protein